MSHRGDPKDGREAVGRFPAPARAEPPSARCDRGTPATVAPEMLLRHEQLGGCPVQGRSRQAEREGEDRAERTMMIMSNFGGGPRAAPKARPGRRPRGCCARVAHGAQARQHPSMRRSVRSTPCLFRPRQQMRARVEEPINGQSRHGSRRVVTSIPRENRPRAPMAHARTHSPRA
jgi:hypothetical protein